MFFSLFSLGKRVEGDYMYVEFPGQSPTEVNRALCRQSSSPTQCKVQDQGLILVCQT